MLHINGRRADGYHRLQTLFQFLDWGDELQFRVTEDPGIVLETPTPGVEPDQNLVVVAAGRLQEASVQAGACPRGARIRLRKRLPMGGGLGGGSSDAATTLAVLNRLWGLELPVERLQELGLALGADVPVFLGGWAAWAEGVGERLQAVEPDEPWYVVIDPGVHVSTKDVFNDPDLTRSTPIGKMANFVRHGGKNDCEAVVRRRYPEVDAALTWLSSRALARLTGTGACVFAAVDNRDQAVEMVRGLPQGWQAYVVRGINRSPLYRRLGVDPAVEKMVGQTFND
jgi:4-diphosphocytidyl-2-C-methyl-D-erythritol kinase